MRLSITPFIPVSPLLSDSKVVYGLPEDDLAAERMAPL